MPVMSGFKAISEIWEGSVVEDVFRLPIIVFTADAIESRKRYILRLGPNVYITKLVEGNQIFNAIRQNLKVELV